MMVLVVGLGVAGGYIAGDGNWFGGIVFAIGFVILLIKWRLETIWDLYPSSKKEKAVDDENKELES